MDYLRELAEKFLRRLPLEEHFHAASEKLLRVAAVINSAARSKGQWKMFWNSRTSIWCFQLGCSLPSLKGSDTKQTVLDEQVVRETEFGTRWERLRYLTEIYANLSESDVKFQP